MNHDGVVNFVCGAISSVSTIAFIKYLNADFWHGVIAGIVFYFIMSQFVKFGRSLWAKRFG